MTHLYLKLNQFYRAAMFLSNCKSLDQSEILYVLSDEAPIDIGPYQNGLAHKEIYMLQ